MIITTTTNHDFVTGERVHFAGDIYWAKVLGPTSVQLYENSSLTVVAASITGESFTSATAALSLITPLDRAPNVDFRPGSSYTNDGNGIIGAFIFNTSITTNIQNYNIKTAAQAAGWDGLSAIFAKVTIAAGVYVWSDSIATAALSTGTGYPELFKIEIINNGFIMGRGGNSVANANGTAGGPAIDINANVSITNTAGYIGGGGGGGGSMIGDSGGGFDVAGATGGGGAGGGSSGSSSVQAGSAAGVAGGAPGQVGSNGNISNYVDGTLRQRIVNATGGGGGRIMPGVGGAGGDYNSAIYGDPGAGGGSGGGGALCVLLTVGYTGGDGGSAGNAGANANKGTQAQSAVGGGGGGWGATGGTATSTGNPASYSRVGGAGGKAVNLNGNTVTWVGGFPSTRVFGAIS